MRFPSPVTEGTTTNLLFHEQGRNSSYATRGDLSQSEHGKSSTQEVINSLLIIIFRILYFLISR